MGRRAPATTAVLFGGGPADGSRREVDDEAPFVDVPEPRGLDGSPAAAVVHRYERGRDGRFRYAGAFAAPSVADAGPAEPDPPVGPESGGTRVPVLVTIVLVLTTLLYAVSEYA